MLINVYAYAILYLSVPNVAHYVLRLLQHEGLPSVSRCRLFSALGGFLSADLACQINALFRCLVLFGYLRNNLTVSELLEKADSDMFHNNANLITAYITYCLIYIR